MALLINMPRLSPTMEEGVLAKWVKKEGDKISPGDIIAEVETDKANMDFPLEDEGVLLKLLVNEGATVKLGDPVAVLGEAGEDPAEAMKGIGAATATGASTAAATAAATAAGAGEAETAVSGRLEAELRSATGRLRVSPLARKIAESRGVDLRLVTGSGPGGRIVKRDIEAAPRVGGTVAPLRAPAQVSLEDQLIPASPMRKTIAKRLTEAKRDIPHIYLTADATVDRLLDLREQLNELGGPKVSVNDLVVKAMALALRRVPDANASFTPEGVLRHGRVDIGVAVSLPDGPITARS
jgi:pyruvate dehydrogenase E2 component (dihydrolipoamide acetyltransferase)